MSYVNLYNHRKAMHFTPRDVYEFISHQTSDLILERRTCTVSQTSFPVFQSEKKLLDKLTIRIGEKLFPLPLFTISPEIRLLQKLLFINQTKLYNNTCALSGKKTIARMSPESGYTIYTNENWSSDKRDSQSYGIPIDETTSVMDTMHRLTQTTPYQDLIGSLSNTKTNAIYTNCTSDIADSYMVFDANNVEKSCYSMLIIDAKYMVDCLNCMSSENCYECVDGEHLFACFYCTKTVAINFSRYMMDCQNCDHCIGCVGLHGKKLYILNTGVTQDEYDNTIKQLQDPSYREQFVQQRKILCDQQPKPAVITINSEKVSGNDISGSQNVLTSFTIKDSQDICYCQNIASAQDCMDVFSYGQSSHSMYNSVQVGRYSHHIYWSNIIGKGENLLYCIEVKKSKNCFGCVNMRDREYCIFNKQYTKEEYETFVPQLIEGMQQDGTRGQFLGSQCSPFPYNDTFAPLFFPVHIIHYSDGKKTVLHEDGVVDVFVDDAATFISKARLQINESTRRPIRRRNREAEINIPAGIELLQKTDVQKRDSNDESILTKAIICELSGRPFRIIQMELDFYRRYHLPLPTIHPDIRHEKRYTSRPPRNLHLRTCDKTGKLTLSVYPQDAPFPVYSEDVYNKKFYG